MKLLLHKTLHGEGIDCTRHYIHCTVISLQTDSGGCTACHSTTGPGNGTSAGICNTYHFSEVHTYIQWNPSSQDSLKYGHINKQDTLLSQMPWVCTIKPLKSGHLTNQDAVPRVSRLEVPLQYLNAGIYNAYIIVHSFP